jgi:hypothetical protein
MSENKLRNSAEEYNRRMLKLCTDIHRLSSSDHLDRFRSFVEYYIEQGGSNERDMYFILFNHIENIDDTLVSRVIDKGDMSVFTDEKISHEQVSVGLFQDLRKCWAMIPTHAQGSLFKNVQNIFIIARHVKSKYYDDLLRVCL